MISTAAAAVVVRASPLTQCAQLIVGTNAPSVQAESRRKLACPLLAPACRAVVPATNQRRPRDAATASAGAAAIDVQLAQQRSLIAGCSMSSIKLITFGQHTQAECPKPGVDQSAPGPPAVPVGHERRPSRSCRRKRPAATVLRSAGRQSSHSCGLRPRDKASEVRAPAEKLDPPQA